MEKIKLDNVTLTSIAEKVNEIVDFINEIQEERVSNLEKEINLIRYGKYMTDEKVITDMIHQDSLSRIIGLLNEA